MGIGLVCAGLYPMVLFGGVLALHAWRTKPPLRRLAGWAASGIGGLWLLNLVRLIVLTRVGISRGAAVLQQTHANIGWVLFALFMAAFWALVLRRAPASAAVTPVP
jgi:exosortase/archaeosortase family protein